MRPEKFGYEPYHAISVLVRMIGLSIVTSAKVSAQTDDLFFGAPACMHLHLDKHVANWETYLSHANTLLQHENLQKGHQQS